MKQLSFIFFFFAILGCQPSPFEVGDGFDSDLFKSDRNGCSNKRAEMAKAIETYKDAFIGHGENEIISTLGRYDLQMLDSRNQKVFIYFLEEGPQCNRKPTEASSMAVYFNATKLVKEITFQKGVL